MKTDNQETINRLAKQAQYILASGMVKADELLIKTAKIQSQLDQFKREVGEQLVKEHKSKS